MLYKDTIYTPVQIAAIDKDEKILGYKIFHQEKDTLFELNPKNFDKTPIASHETQPSDLTKYPNDVKVSKELTRILALPDNNNFKSDFYLYLVNPRNLKQVIGFKIFTNTVPKTDEKKKESYETLMIFNVYHEAVLPAKAKISEVHVVMDGGKAFGNWKTDNFVMNMVGRHYMFRNLTEYVLIDSLDYSVLEYGQTQSIKSCENFAGYDPASNKAYSAFFEI